ncbi:MAG: hypothetical protein ACI4DV_05950 [Lachnospiraceae bacterium]
MLTESDRAVLNEAYRSCSMGTEAINTILNKVQNSRMALDLNRQSCKLSSFYEKIVQKMAMEQEKPKGDGAGKAMLWAGLQMNTLANDSTEHIAELMIRGNTAAITETMKVLKEHKDARKEYCELAEELMDFEEKCIETFKGYLK